MKKPLSFLDLESAAETLEAVSYGHCSFGSVAPEYAERWRRVAEWLRTVAPRSPGDGVPL